MYLPSWNTNTTNRVLQGETSGGNVRYVTERRAYGLRLEIFHGAQRCTARTCVRAMGKAVSSSVVRMTHHVTRRVCCIR